MRQIIALLKKDFLLEIRRQHNFYGLLLYIAATVFVLNLALTKGADGSTWNSLFWMIQLFVCVTAVAKSFLQEGRGVMLYYYSIASPQAFILAKLLYNALLMAVMSLLTLLLFAVFLDSPVVDPVLFCGLAVLGGAGLSLTFSLMSAIAAKAGGNAALIAILGFPVILPQLILLIRLSKLAFAEVFREGAVLQLFGLIGTLDAAVVVLALILFPYLWKD